MRVHALVAQTLITHGVDTVFGVLGDANLHMIAEYAGRKKGRYIGAVHEGGAVSMADGYARIGCRVGVASVTHGPGATNTATALTEAVRAGSALLVLTGDTPAQPDHLQRLNLRALAELTGADYQRVLTSEGATADLVRALRKAEATNRPILLDIPADLADADIDPRPRRAVPAWTAQHAIAPDDESLDRALGVIASAQRPVILAGRGAVRSNARAALCELAELLGAPLTTTLLARELFRGHPANIGIMGTLSTNVATAILQRADCVIAVGAGLNRFTSADGSLLEGKPLVRVDNDIAKLADDTRANVDVHGDAHASARAMHAQLHAAQFKARGRWYGETPNELQRFVDHSTPTALDVRAAMARLDELLPADRVVVTDTGRFVTAPWQHLHVQRPTDFAHTLNFASIGLGIATAIGAAFAQPDKLTVAVAGDGGGMMGIVELATAVSAKLPLLVVICNDGAYGMEHRALRRAGLDPTLSLLHRPGFAPIAEAIGAHGIEVRTIDDLERAVKQLDLPLKRPALLDLRLDPSLDIEETQ